MSDIKEKIKKIAVELGFCDIGFAKAEPLEEEIINYKKWLDAGYNASMTYMERNIEKRYDVRNILPGVKTVIVTAYNYFTPFKHNNQIPESTNDSEIGKLYGKISRYAFGNDYHNVILPKLELLAARIEELYFATGKDKIKNKHSGNQSKCYVDTGPLLEKVWAEKAGIGWQAKNSTIISKKHGSWIFLGIILTTLEFENDNQLRDHCGKCRICIEACPTGAIIEPKIIDSRKCISYWTIETKPEIDFPDSIINNLNGWLFGCDICQDVCPWNVKFQIQTNDLNFYPVDNETSLIINDVANMDKENFTVRFKNSPLKRPRFEGIQRNARALMEYYNKKQ